MQKKFTNLKNNFYLIPALLLMTWLGLNLCNQTVQAQTPETPCALCGCLPDADLKFITCEEGHLTDGDCLNHEVENVTDLLNFVKKGLSCHGQMADESPCTRTLPYKRVRSALNEEQLEQLDQRLANAKKNAEVEDVSFKLQVWKYTEAIDNAFVLCCPEEGCGGALDKIEGCNAATCSNPDCKITFCYLCLKPQFAEGDNSANNMAHKHVLTHSGNYWEFRNGFMDRYHWLLARKSLSHSFATKISDDVRAAVIPERAILLKEKNMLPFPAGLTTKAWLEEVRANTEIPDKKIVELLQNEYLFRKQKGDEHNAVLVANELRARSAKVLETLDVPSQTPGQAVQRNLPINPILDGDNRITEKFRGLGHSYNVNNLFIISGASNEMMDYESAKKFCRNHDGELMSEDDWNHLVAALREMRGDDEYHPEEIPDLQDKEFWAFNQAQEAEKKRKTFNGTTATFGEMRQYGKGIFARCKRAL